MQRDANKFTRMIINGIFCLFLGGIFVLQWILPDRARSESENRILAQKPVFSIQSVLNGSFMENTEEWFTDQFPLRDAWTGLRARCEQILGKREFHGVFLGNNGNDACLMARVDAPDEKILQRNLSHVKTFAQICTEEHIPVYIGLIPSAAGIYDIPAGAESWEQRQIIQQAEAMDLKILPLYETLYAHREEEIYYRTDHHWTSLGAYYGANVILRAMGREPLAREDFTPEVVTDEFQGTLYSRSGVHWLKADRIERWVSAADLTVSGTETGTGQVYHEEYLWQKDRYSYFLGGNQPLCVIHNPQIQEGKILLVRDSYADALAPFLTRVFGEVHLADLRFYRAPLREYLRSAGIDVALILYSVPNFLTDRNLPLLNR